MAAVETGAVSRGAAEDSHVSRHHRPRYPFRVDAGLNRPALGFVLASGCTLVGLALAGWVAWYLAQP